MVVTRLGSETCPQPSEGEPQNGSSFPTVASTRHRGAASAEAATTYYSERRSSSFLRRATSATLEKSLDLTRQYCVLWVGLAIFIVAVRQFLSDGGFSSSLTLSAALQAFAYLLLLVKVVLQWSADGVSYGSLVLLAVSLGARLYSNLFFLGYLPVDRSGDWLYQSVEVFSLGLLLLLLFCVGSIRRTTADTTHAQPKTGRSGTSWKGKTGTAGSFPLNLVRSAGTLGSRLWNACTSSPYLLELGIVCVAALLSLCLHATRNRHMLSDLSWAFGLYLESFALLPQLVLMTQQAAGSGADVEKWTAHYLASMAASNLASLFFWWKTSSHLVPRVPNSSVGLAVFLAVIFKNLVMMDYLYHYLMATFTGQNLSLRRWSSFRV